MGAADAAKRCSALEHIADFLSNVLQSGGLFICGDAGPRAIWGAHLRRCPRLLPRPIWPGGTCRAHRHMRVLCAMAFNRYRFKGRYRYRFSAPG